MQAAFIPADGDAKTHVDMKMSDWLVYKDRLQEEAIKADKSDCVL